MSGHSKWSTIKRKKEATDAKRGQLFTRLARELAIAAREGGDPATNFSLRLAMDKARTANMPKDNIERAIKRGTGELKGEDLVEVIYEGYGPHGIAMLVSVVTDNRNRSIADVRRIFSRKGGTVAEPGAVAWQFKRRGYITIPAEGNDGDRVFEVALEADADDVILGGDVIEVLTSLDAFQKVREAFQDAGIEVESAELSYFPDMPVTLEQNAALQVMGVVDALEELDDVQQVYSTLDVTDELMAAYEEAE
jgi:YebC/PmpR family DNA-binding regulatory protein